MPDLSLSQRKLNLFLDEPGQFCFRSIQCQLHNVNESGLKDRLCPGCHKDKAHFSKTVNEQKQSNEIHSSPAKMKTRVDAISQSPMFADNTIRDRNRMIQEKDIEIRKLKILLGESGRTAVAGEGDDVLKALCLADEHGVLEDKRVSKNLPVAVEFIAHLEAAKEHLKRNGGSMVGFKYRDEVLKFSISFLQQVGGTAWETISERFLLPSTRHLQNLAASVRQSTGEGDGIMCTAIELTAERIKREIERSPDKFADRRDGPVEVVLALDTMSIENDFIYSSTGRIVGIDKVESFNLQMDLFSELIQKQEEESNVESEPETQQLLGDNEKQAQDHLVIYFTPAESQFRKLRVLGATFNVAGLDQYRIEHIELSLTNALRLNNFDVTATCGDGAGQHQGLARRLNDTKSSSIIPNEIQKKYPDVDFDHKVACSFPDSSIRIWIEDIFHVLKRVVNALEDSDNASGKEHRQMGYMVDGIMHPMNLAMLSDVNKAEGGGGLGLQIDYKKTAAHYKRSNSQKMKVSPAAQITSNSTIQAIERLEESGAKSVGGVPINQFSALKELCRYMNLLVDMYNGKCGVVTPDNAHEHVTALLEALNWFSKWKKSTKGDEDEEKLFLPSGCWEGVQSLCLGGAVAIQRMVVEKGRTIDLRTITSDPCENHFNSTRQRGGSSHAVTAITANSAATASLICRLFGSKKGNNGAGSLATGFTVSEAVSHSKKNAAGKKRVGTNGVLGKRMTTELQSDSSDASGWGGSSSSPTNSNTAGVDSAPKQRKKPISSDGKSACRKCFARHPYPETNPEPKWRDPALVETMRVHNLESDQVKRQFKNYIQSIKSQDATSTSIAASASAPMASSSASAARANRKRPATSSPAAAATSKRKRSRISSAAQMELNEIFTDRGYTHDQLIPMSRDRTSGPTQDAGMNNVLNKYKLDGKHASDQLKRWKDQGGKLSTAKLTGTNKQDFADFLRTRLTLGPKEFMKCCLEDIVDGSIGTSTVYGVQMSKLKVWRPDLRNSLSDLIDDEEVIEFFAEACNDVFNASVECFSNAGKDQGDREKERQRLLSVKRKERAGEWNEIAVDKGISKRDAYSLFIYTYYFALQQFVYIARNGSEDGSHAISRCDEIETVASTEKIVVYYVTGWLLAALQKRRVKPQHRVGFESFVEAHSITKDEASVYELPTYLIDLRSKTVDLKLASSDLYKFVLILEATYKKYANHKYFARWGSELFLKINEALLADEGLYNGRFRVCIEALQLCSEETEREIFELLLGKYRNMRGKFTVKAEKARTARIGNTRYTHRQKVGMTHEFAKLVGELDRCGTVSSDVSAEEIIEIMDGPLRNIAESEFM